MSAPAPLKSTRVLRIVDGVERQRPSMRRLRTTAAASQPDRRRASCDTFRHDADRLQRPIASWVMQGRVANLISSNPWRN